MKGALLVFALQWRRSWPWAVLAGLLGTVAALGPLAVASPDGRAEIWGTWISLAVPAAVLAGAALGALAVASPRRWLLALPLSPLGIAIGHLAAASSLALVSGLLVSLPPLAVGWEDLVHATKNVNWNEERARAHLRTIVLGYGSLALLAGGACVSGAMALGGLVRSPLVAIPGVLATGGVALAVLAQLVRVNGPIGIALAAPFAGLCAAWIGTSVGAVLGMSAGRLDARRTSLLTSVALPVGGVLVGVLALAEGAWIARQPPGALTEIVRVEPAPRGSWAVVTGELAYTLKEQHFLVDLEGDRWLRLDGPVPDVLFTAEGTRAYWVRKGIPGSSLRGADLATMRTWSCAGLPTAARLLDVSADGARVAVARGRTEVRVVAAETCEELGDVVVPDQGSIAGARFVGDALRLWSGRPGGLTIQELSLVDGTTSTTLSTAASRGVSAVGSGAERILSGTTVLDGRTGEALFTAQVPDQAGGAVFLDDGALVFSTHEFRSDSTFRMGVAAFAPGGEPLATLSRQTNRGYAVHAEPLPGCVLACNEVCVILDVTTGHETPVPGAVRPTGRHTSITDPTRRPAAGSPWTRLAFDGDGGLVRFDADGSVTSLRLPSR